MGVIIQLCEHFVNGFNGIGGYYDGKCACIAPWCMGPVWEFLGCGFYGYVFSVGRLGVQSFVHKVLSWCPFILELLVQRTKLLVVVYRGRPRGEGVLAFKGT